MEIEKKEVLPQEFMSEISSNPELVKFANSNLTEVEVIASNYAPLMQEVQEQMEVLKTLEIGNPDHVELARKGKAALGKIKSKVDKQKDEDKVSIKVKGNFIQSLRNTVWNAAVMTQESFKEIIEHEERLEQQRLERLQEERVALLSPYLEDAHERDLKQMDQDVWEAYLEKKQKEYHDRIEAEQEAERKRWEQEEKESTLRERLLEIAKFGKHAEEQPTLDTTPGEWVVMKLKAEENLKAYEAEQEKIRKEKEEAEAKLAAERKAREEEERKKREEVEAKIKERRDKAGKYLEDKGFKYTLDHSGLYTLSFGIAQSIPHCVSFKKNNLHFENDLELERFYDSVETKIDLGRSKYEEALKKEGELKAEQERQALAKKSKKVQLEAWINSFSIPEAPINDSSTKEIKAKFEAFKKWAIEQI